MILVIFMLGPSSELESQIFNAPAAKKSYQECMENGKSAVEHLQLKFPNVSFSYFCKEVEMPPPGIHM